MTVHSQLAPLPVDVPFRLVSKTIGSGAYACIKKAVPPDQPSPVFAVKFIHKAYAQKHGRVSMKQLNLEITLHSHLCSDSRPHQNIIQFFSAGEDNDWKWIAMELAEGGDLFDKIESDVGVGEDVAHAYFTQLLGAIEFMHNKGVGHRDIKPENVLLSLDGNLKIADFGLATLFAHGGKRKSSKTSCGSPPYTAPEVVRCEAGGHLASKSAAAGLAPGYYADQVDVWSCGVVLFVLLVGNTPWDEPSDRSEEFHQFVQANGYPEGDELFDRLPSGAHDMLCGVLSVDPKKRYTISQIKQHPWYRRKNRFLRSDGTIANSVALATTMFETMKIDFEQDPYAHSSQSQSQRRHDGLYSPTFVAAGAGEDAMDLDQSQMQTRTNTTIPASQALPGQDTPTAEVTFDWERPAVASSQAHRPEIASASISFTPQDSPPRSRHSNSNDHNHELHQTLSEEPTMSQFTPAPAVPLSRTQFARRFADILPADRMTRFYSPCALRPLIQLLAQSLGQLGVPMPSDPLAVLRGGAGTGTAGNESTSMGGGELLASLKINARDARQQRLRGEVLVEQFAVAGQGQQQQGCQVDFVKMNGDPVEWRRFFKKAVILCREAVYIPEEL